MASFHARAETSPREETMRVMVSVAILRETFLSGFLIILLVIVKLYTDDCIKVL